MTILSLKTKIDQEGKLLLSGLSDLAGEEVEIIIKTSLSHPKYDLEENLARLQASFGTIKSLANLSKEDLRRENIYGDDGR